MQFSFVIDINSFSIDRIGGTDSYIRRLTDVLKRNNHSVQIIKYNKKNRKDAIEKEKSVNTFYNFDILYKYINNLESNVFICYLNPFDRLRFAIRRFLFTSKENVNLILFFYPNSILKKLLRSIEILLADYENIICVSNRILKFSKILKKIAI